MQKPKPNLSPNPDEGSPYEFGSGFSQPLIDYERQAINSISLCQPDLLKMIKYDLDRYGGINSVPTNVQIVSPKRRLLDDINSLRISEALSTKYKDPGYMEMLTCVYKHTLISDENTYAAEPYVKEYFRLVDNLSDGQAGLVFKAVQGGSGLSFIIKTTLNDRVADEILHEAYIGLTQLNPLRRLCPNFCYVYGVFTCGRSFLASSEVCETVGYQPYIITEYIEGKSLRSMIADRTISNIAHNNVKDFFYITLSSIMQVYLALELSHRYANKYAHVDLHDRNVLLKPIISNKTPIKDVDSLHYIKYNRPDGSVVYILAKYVATIIDYGFSRCIIPDAPIMNNWYEDSISIKYGWNDETVYYRDINKLLGYSIQVHRNPVEVAALMYVYTKFKSFKAKNAAEFTKLIDEDALRYFVMREEEAEAINKQNKSLFNEMFALIKSVIDMQDYMVNKATPPSHKWLIHLPANQVSAFDEKTLKYPVLKQEYTNEIQEYDNIKQPLTADDIKIMLAEDLAQYIKENSVNNPPFLISKITNLLDDIKQGLESIDNNIIAINLYPMQQLFSDPGQLSSRIVYQATRLFDIIHSCRTIIKLQNTLTILNANQKKVHYEEISQTIRNKVFPFIDAQYFPWLKQAHDIIISDVAKKQWPASFIDRIKIAITGSAPKIIQFPPLLQI